MSSFNLQTRVEVKGSESAQTTLNSPTGGWGWGGHHGGKRASYGSERPYTGVKRQHKRGERPMEVKGCTNAQGCTEIKLKLFSYTRMAVYII